MVPSWVQFEPLFVEYWNVTVPVGVTSKTPAIVAAAVVDPPRDIGLVGFRVKAIAVGLELPTIENILLQLHDAGLMVEKPVISSDPRGLLLKFPAVPFTFGKLHVSIPNGKSIQRKDS